MNDSTLPHTQLLTVSEVIDALGGTAVVARLLGLTMGAVTNWRATGRINSKFFLILSAALADKGLSAPPDLWGIRPLAAVSSPT